MFTVLLCSLLGGAQVAPATSPDTLASPARQVPPAPVDGYTLWNARVAWSFETGPTTGQLILQGRNLTGVKYIAFTEPDPDGNSYQPGPERELFAGVRLTLR